MAIEWYNKNHKPKFILKKSGQRGAPKWINGQPNTIDYYVNYTKSRKGLTLIRNGKPTENFMYMKNKALMSGDVELFNKIEKFGHQYIKSGGTLTENGLQSLLNYRNKDKMSAEARFMNQVDRGFRNAGFETTEIAAMYNLDIDDLYNEKYWSGNGIFTDPITGQQYQYEHGYSNNVFKRI